MEKVSKQLIVGVDITGKDVSCLSVGVMCNHGHVLLLNHFTGEEAQEMYSKLVGTNKSVKPIAKPNQIGLIANTAFIDEIVNQQKVEE